MNSPERLEGMQQARVNIRAELAALGVKGG
jgi:hypothetical protein